MTNLAKLIIRKELIHRIPSTNDIDRPQEALTVAKRYLRWERPLSALVVVIVVSLFLGTYRTTSLLPAVAVAAILLAVVRAPILQSCGTVRLRTDDDPEEVADAFTGPTPPVLAFQWGIADAVTTENRTVTYRTTSLFGLRSAEVTVRRRTDSAPNGNRRVELVITANDRPWATYTATISGDGGHTTVDVEYASNRRFGLRRVPQQLVAERYREQALAVQGYTVGERDSHFGI